MSLPNHSPLGTLLYNYKLFLQNKGYSTPTVKNYLSDLRHLFDWSEKSFGPFHPNRLNRNFFVLYRQNLEETLSDKQSIVLRRLSSLNKFLEWAVSDRLVEETVLADYREVSSTPRENLGKPKLEKSSAPLHQKALHHLRFTRPNWYHRYHKNDWSTTAHYIILFLIILTLGGLFFYSYLIKPDLDKKVDLSKQIGSVLPATAPPRVLSYQGRLTNNSDQPITSSTTVVFRIWDQLSAGTEGDCSGFDEDCLWKSKNWSVTPDANGIFSVLLGDTGSSDTAIPATLFTDYSDLYLEITAGGETLSPRQRVASAAYALNSDALDGLDSAQFLHSFESDNFTSGTLTTDAGTTMDVNGTLAWGGATISEALNLNSQNITGIGTNLTAAAGLTLATTATGALTLDSGTTGNVNLGTGNNAKTLSIGTGNAGNIFNIGTDNTVSDTISIGSALDNITITSDQWSVTNAGVLTVASCSGCGGGSPTPWTSDIDADGWDLTDLGNIQFRNDTLLAGTNVYIGSDNTGDLNLNALSAKTLNLQIAGTDEYNFSSSGLELNSNNITGAGAITFGGNLTGSSGANTYSLTTTTTSGTLFGLTASGAVTGTVAGITADSLTTGTLVSLSADGITTGKGFDITSTSAVATSAKLLNIDHTATFGSGAGLTGNLASLSRSLTGPSSAAPVLDAVYPAGGGGTDINNASNVSWSHTLASNAVLIVTVNNYFNTTTSVTWDSTENLTQICQQTGGGGNSVEIWALVNPSATGTKTVRVNFSGNTYGRAGSVSFTGVDTSSGTSSAFESCVDNTGTSTDASVSVTADSIQTAVGIAGTETTANPSIADDASTIWVGQSSFFGVGPGASSYKSNTTSLNYSFSLSVGWAATAVPVNGSAPFTLSGALATLSSNCTGSGCADTSNILSLTQSYASSSGDVLKITSSGTGSAISVNTSNFKVAGSGEITTASNINLSSASPNLNLTATDNTASLSINDASGNNLLVLKDLSTNFGASLSAGAFIDRNSKYEAEFKKNRNTITSDTAGTQGGGLGDGGGWGAYESGTNGCTFTTLADTTNGIIDLEADNANIGCLVMMDEGANNAHLILDPDNLPVLLMKVKPDAADSTSATYTGMGDSTDGVVAAPANFIGFSNDNAGTLGGTWVGITRSSSTSTTVVCTGQTISTTQFALLMVEVRATNNVRFFVDNDVSNGINFVECGSGSATNIPTSNLAPQIHFQERTGGTANTSLNVDFFRWWQDDDPDGFLSPVETKKIEADLTTQANLSQFFESDDLDVEEGTVVSIDVEGQSAKVMASGSPYEPGLAGVVVKEAGFELYNGTFDGLRIASFGRASVKVSTENGPIRVGDYLTSSSNAGVAMKSTKPGKVLGQALSAYDGKEIGKAVVLLNIQYTNPNQKEYFLTLDEEENIATTISASTKFVWNNSLGIAVAWVSETGEAFFQRITALLGDFQKLVFGELSIKKESQAAGEFTFDSGQTEITIESDKVKEDSLIYVTPTTKTAGLIAYIKEKKPGEGFIVGLERSIGDTENDATASAIKSIKFNWLIVNQED